ncbi:MAG: hypothetical protein R2991_16985, partial [Thermoanaerobaculia bacterium]
MKHRDTVFHVQTEDKGVETASVESLIYIGGRILARRMVTYKALLERGEGRDAVSRLMDKQHRMMISQIKGGRFDEQVFDGAPAPEGAVAPPPPRAETKVQLPVGGQLQEVEAVEGLEGVRPRPATPSEPARPAAAATPAKPGPVVP